MKLDIFILICIIVILILVIILMTKLKNCKKSTENFRKCICSGPATEECQDTIVVDDLYVKNKLTEYSNLKNKGWGNVSPGDINFPVCNGCGCGSINNLQGPGWRNWDYTDFGN